MHPSGNAEYTELLTTSTMASTSTKKTGTSAKKGMGKRTGKKVGEKATATAKCMPKQILAEFKKVGARVETNPRVKLRTKQDMALWYTPGVGTVASHLAEHPKDARLYSVKRNSVAVVSDGSAVLGLGNIGPYGALPVMEGKSLIFRELAGIDAWPIVLDIHASDEATRIDEVVRTVLAIAPGFGGINLEDFKAPECFEIERRIVEALESRPGVVAVGSSPMPPLGTFGFGGRVVSVGGSAIEGDAGGFRAYPWTGPGFFESIPWSSDDTLAAHLALCRRSGWSFGLLPALHDIDTHDDWLAHRARKGLPDGGP